MLYHISREELDGAELIPRVPANKLKSEDATIPRICFALTIEGCLNALSNDGIAYGTIYNVYRPTTRQRVIFPTLEQVPDVYLTGEVWVTAPVVLKKIAVLTAYERIDACPSNNYYLGDKLTEVMTYNFSVRYIEDDCCIALKL